MVDLEEKEDAARINKESDEIAAKNLQAEVRDCNFFVCNNIIHIHVLPGNTNNAAVLMTLSDNYYYLSLILTGGHIHYTIS